MTTAEMAPDDRDRTAHVVPADSSRIVPSLLKGISVAHGRPDRVGAEIADEVNPDRVTGTER